MIRCLSVLALLTAAGALCQGRPQDDIQTVITQGRGTPEGRAAWARLSAGGPELLPLLLEAMDTPSTATANWLRTAFDRILDRALAANKKGIDADRLLAFAKEPKRAGRARRLALEVVERLRPGTSRALFRDWLEDPEFRFDSVAAALEQAGALARGGAKEKAVAGYRTALNASRDVGQGRAAAVGLLDLGIKASVAEHLGFLMDWYLIGPFDAAGMKGFTTPYPPEHKVDLKGEYEGKERKVRWVRYRVSEPSPKGAARHIALVDLRARAALGDADDAVAFAYTEFTVSTAREVEFRGSADDNFTVWVNGVRVFGFEEYRNGVRLDRHRFRVRLRAGRNTVLVKVVQSPANPEPNWEFFLRIVDDSGKGIGHQSALPPAS
ncbi:MAG: hypothetical protein L0Z62_05210 [Gemmataceae bacterium]|nr:hypothetical protein [Gemmataceae bacterium]